VVISAVRTASRPRGFVRVAGPDAADYLERMVSNTVASLPVGASCDALLLTAKARVIAPLRVLRRDQDDYLLLTEPELAETVRAVLLRSRFAAKAEIDLEPHDSYVLVGDGPPLGAIAVATSDYGVPAWEVLDHPIARAGVVADDELERLRIEAGTPAWGKEIDDRVLPAEAGLVERAVSFTKGCYPGQEPIARLQHRGHANRRLRILELEGESVPARDEEIRHGEKVVGRVTSAVPGLGLGYVRTEVPGDAELAVGRTRARILR
jgi:tRNA-modifying protein YgfZ